MNVYLLTQDSNLDRDSYRAVFVFAETEEEARLIFPSSYYVWVPGSQRWGFVYADGRVEEEAVCPHEWVMPEMVGVKLVGTAVPGATRGRVLDSV